MFWTCITVIVATIKWTLRDLLCGLWWTTLSGKMGIIRGLVFISSTSRTIWPVTKKNRENGILISSSRDIIQRMTNSRSRIQILNLIWTINFVARVLVWGSISVCVSFFFHQTLFILSYRKKSVCVSINHVCRFYLWFIPILAKVVNYLY